MKQVLARVIDQQAIHGHFQLLTLEAPEIASLAQPGQFVHVRCGDTLEPLLRRPISLHKIEADQGKLFLLYHVVGRGTQLLAAKKAGDQVDLMGPLGHGFSFPEGMKQAVVVGGGIGAAPLLPLIEKLVELKVATTVILGARSAEFLVGAEPLANLPVKLLKLTEDGSVGKQGLVTDALRQLLAEQQIDYLYSCGPKPMLKAVTELALAAHVRGEVSLEERMGCGVGACLACACKVKKTVSAKVEVEGGCGCSPTTAPQPDYSYKRVCDHGPVFALEEVLFDD